MSDKDLMTREYDIRQVEEDPRLARCKKEFLTLLVMISVTILAIIVICYGYLLGVPMWMALSAIVALVGTAACLIYCLRGVKDASLDSDAADTEVRS